MRSMLAALATAMIVALTASARADAATGTDWFARCQDVTTTTDTAKATYCFSYARGLADGLSIWAGVSPETAPACIPTDVQGHELVDTGVRYVKAHPEAAHLAAGILLAHSFIETWPCDGRRTTSAPAR